MAKEKLVVIDGHALIHRAYHAIPPLTTKNGEVVNAVYGFTMILLNVLRDLKPRCVAIAFDLPGKTLRHEEYELYKAHRKATPDDLISQFAKVREVAEAFSIPIYSKEGYEADDVIGAIAKQAPENVETIIVTGDLDELQLVNKKTKVYTMRRGFTDTIIYDEAAVKEKYGLTPTQFIDFKALKGDASDNIPGVAGIGEKTASALIAEYDNLDNLYANLDKLKPAIAAKLKTGKESAFLSLKLSRIETDLEVGFELSHCIVHEYDRNKVFDLFQEFGFKSLLSKIPEGPKNKEAKEEKTIRKHLATAKYHLVDNEKDFNSFLEKLSQQKTIAIDTETDSLNQIEANLVGLSISWEEGEAYYIPVGHKNCEQLDLPQVIKKLKPLLESPQIEKVGHNIKYDYVVLKRHGVTISGITFDTMVAAYLLNPNARAQKLDELAFSELGLDMIKIHEIIGHGKEQLTFDLGDLSTCKDYACEDGDITFRLYKALFDDLKKTDQLELMRDIEAPLIPVLGEMELCGIAIDQKSLATASKEFTQRIAELEKSIWKRAGQEFNIASPAQLSVVLFEKLKLDEKVDDKRDLKKLKSGGYSTSASELEKLRGLDPIIEEIFEFRELTKLKNTYVDVLPNLIDRKTGRIHTSYNQAITQTGRLSSSDPNLQNIPIRTETGKRIRSAFVAAPGKALLSADYSQIELRVIAHIAGDDVMREIFNEGRDIHTETAAAVYQVPDSEVTPAMRRIAKIINFGIIYGVSPHGLKQQTGMRRDEAKLLIDRYFELHPKIKAYTNNMIAGAKELGYVETIFGRRRYLPEIRSSNFAVRGAAERMAINMPIQGTAADLMKLAMIDIARDLTTFSPQTIMLLQVHDELIFEVPKEECERLGVFIKEKMDNVVKLSVPIETAVHFAPNWGDTKG